MSTPAPSTTVKLGLIIVCIGFVTESSNWNWPVATALNLPHWPFAIEGLHVEVVVTSGCKGFPL